MMNSRVRFSPVLFLASAYLAGLMGCAQEEQAAPAASLAPVLGVPVRLLDVTENVEATGQLIAKFEAAVASQVNGQVTSIWAEEGQAVIEGEALLEIDPQRRVLELSNAQASMAQAEAQVLESRRDFKRIQNLRKRGATSEALLDDARTALELSRSRQKAAEAHLGLAERALADSTVRAPFSGLIARRHVSTGEYLSVGMPLFELVALDPIEVEFSVAEKDSSRIRLGQVVQITLAPFPDLIFEAEVTMIAPTIEPITRTLRAKALFSNSEGRLKPGLFAHVRLGLESRRGVVMVPEESLVQRADGTVLFRLNDKDRVERLVVTPGVLREGWVEVEGDVKQGDVVVARGQEQIVDGALVSRRSKAGAIAAPPTVAAGGSSFAAGAGQ